MIHENNWVVTTKKGKGKLPLFCVNVEWVIPIYADGVMNVGYDDDVRLINILFSLMTID